MPLLPDEKNAAKQLLRQLARKDREIKKRYNDLPAEGKRAIQEIAFCFLKESKERNPSCKNLVQQEVAAEIIATYQNLPAAYRKTLNHIALQIAAEDPVVKTAPNVKPAASVIKHILSTYGNAEPELVSHICAAYIQCFPKRIYKKEPEALQSLQNFLQEQTSEPYHVVKEMLEKKASSYSKNSHASFSNERTEKETATPITQYRWVQIGKVKWVKKEIIPREDLPGRKDSEARSSSFAQSL